MRGRFGAYRLKNKNNPYAGLNALERSEKRLERAKAAERAAKRELAEAIAEYKSSLKLARKYVPRGTFSVAKGFSVSKVPTRAQMKKVRKQAEEIIALKSRPHIEYKTRSKRRLAEAQKFAGHADESILTRAFVPTQTPEQKAELIFEHGKAPYLKDTESGAIMRFVPLPDIIEYTDDEGNVQEESIYTVTGEYDDEGEPIYEVIQKGLVDYVEEQIRIHAPDAKYVLIRNGNNQIWAQGGDRKSIAGQMAFLMRRYGIDKFTDDDPESHYFGNWMTGLMTYSTVGSFNAFIDDRQEEFAKHGARKHRARTKGRKTAQHKPIKKKNRAKIKGRK